MNRDGRELGRGYQAVVRRVRSPVGELVVKSPHANRLLAWFGRRAIRREARVYDCLSGIDGIARSHGLAAGEHLVLEHIDGPTLRAQAALLEDRDRFFERLLHTLQAMHAAGVAHGDLKRKENLLVGPGETPSIIDFGIACIREDRAGGGLNRLWFRLMRQMDLNAYIKLKYGPALDAMTPDDRPLYRPLWIEKLARRLRGPWKFLTLRQTRKRRRHGEGDA